VYVQRPEYEAAQRALQHRDQNIAFDCRPNHGREFRKQRPFVRLVQRDRLFDFQEQFVAVAYQEESQIEHDGNADEKFKCRLADTDNLGCQILAAFGQRRADPVLNGTEVGKPGTDQKALRPNRQVHLQPAGNRD
jgi:hypothetical protein